jgi:hypothetical protein
MFMAGILGILRGPILSLTYLFFFFLFVNHLGLESEIVSYLPGKDTSSSLFRILLQDGQGDKPAKNFI